MNGYHKGDQLIHVNVWTPKTLSKQQRDFFETMQNDEHFEELQKIVTDPFINTAKPENYTVTVLVKGGGIHSQAEAVRHGISRGLVEVNETDKSQLKHAGFLKRDPRSKERRKFGLKKARKAPQWSKR